MGFFPAAFFDSFFSPTMVLRSWYRSWVGDPLPSSFSPLPFLKKWMEWEMGGNDCDDMVAVGGKEGNIQKIMIYQSLTLI